MKSAKSYMIDSLDEVSIDHTLRQKSRLIFTELVARTELLGNLKDFGKILVDTLK